MYIYISLSLSLSPSPFGDRGGNVFSFGIAQRRPRRPREASRRHTGSADPRPGTERADGRTRRGRVGG